MTIGDRVKKLREQKGLTQSELAERLGYKSKSSVAHIENGRDIPRAMIVKLSDVLKTSPAYLMGWVDEEQKEQEKSNIRAVLDNDKVRMIPVYKSVSAGFGAYADNYIVDYMPCYIVSESEASNTLCITVEGDSMYPKIEDGDVIQVLKQDWAENNQIAVVLIDGENAVVKKIKYDADTIYLVSINPEYKTREFFGEDRNRLKILGVVRKIIKSV